MNDLEELFNRQPPYSEADLVRVIKHFRETRAMYQAGGKPKKETGPKAQAIDLAALGLAEAPKAVPKLNLFGGKK